MSADGKTFDSDAECRKHEAAFLGEEVVKQQEAVEKIKRSYWYRTWGKSIPEHKIATWNIYGEDANCDLGGFHHEPLIATVHGTFNKALNYAARLPRFWAWGSGGRIEEVQVQSLE